YTHTWKDATGTAQTVTRTFDEEMENYANWFAYYRTRIQAVKSVTSLVFNELDDTYRVGFHTLSNNPATSFVDIADFTPGQKTAWWAQLFGIAIKLNQETPNLDAITRVGDYYLNGGSPQLSGSTDPIILSCQKNWHMLFTDGLTNQPKLPTTSVGNVDKTVPALPHAVAGLTTGQPWPPLYRENLTASNDSASDYTTFYWVTDLRTNGAVGTDNVPSSNVDPATWQHVNFAAMSLGTEGKLPAGSQKTTESQLATGVMTWPQPYPNVYKPDESGVDDLWHAAINGRGRFVNAKSSDELKLGMGQILADITNQAGSRAGVAFQNVNLSGANKYIYRVNFEPGWGGSVTKVEVDPKDPGCTQSDVTNAVAGCTAVGDPKEISIAWEASTQLTNIVTPSVGKPTPWFTDRKIVTMDSSGKPVPFLWGNLSASQKNSLAPGKPLRGQAILEFLRGDRSNEGIELGQFRARTSPLGDIVASQVAYVGAPVASYLDANDPGYTAFKNKYASRAARVYVGANDGMLHAFDDATGDETWAYVPLGVYRSGATGLGALSYQDGALPAFRHHYYVNSTPRIVDVDFGAGSGDWRTLLVEGLGKGGRSYVGVDITDPSAFTSETEVAKRIVWEFSDPDMGYTYGKPIITKTHNSKWGSKWVAIVPVGYNNASGIGKIFFVDVATGAKLMEMSTGVGSAANPAGLAHISGYTMDYRNQLTEQIYGGDLYGNFWRFDISDSDSTNWKVVKLAQLADPGGTPQPVTTPPQIEIDVQNGVDRWVFVGTGKLYHQSDLADTQVQSLYAIRDGSATQPKNYGKVLARSDLAVVSNATGLAVKPDTGWYDDLPPGERIVVPPQATLSTVVYSGTLPQNDPCLTGQPANIYAREYSKAASLLTDDNGAVVESVYSAAGSVGLEVLAGDPSTFKGDVPTLYVGVTLGTTGKLKLIKLNPPAFVTAHRMSWRLLGE
ncbi:MAG: PilC/PilY family type IV pilus protein, partial [Casimicrobiaceae bacterium]